MNAPHPAARHPCQDFAGFLPTTRGTRPLPLDPLPSSLFQAENYSFPTDRGLAQKVPERFQLNPVPKQDAACQR
jgi:hypothetical protein